MSEGSPDTRGVAIQFGKHKLTGRSASAVLTAILLAILGWLIYKRPWEHNWPMWLSGAGWIAFIVYWNAAARNSAPAKKSESRESRMVHQTLLNVALLCLFAPIPGLRLRFLPHSSAAIAIGFGVQLGFFLLALWARRHLGRHWSGEIAIKVEHELIRSGPYRVLRHPIYTAMLGMCAGTAIVSGELHALFGLGTIVFAYWRKIRLEETNLREAFGTEYEAYRRATWALVPGVF